MTHDDALEALASHPHIRRYRELCAEDNPDLEQRDAYRALVIRDAGGRPEYPPLAAQAGNLAGALWDWATSGFATADDAEQARRRAICAACPEWVPADRRCRICGCRTDAKVSMRSAHCPLDPPRW